MNGLIINDLVSRHYAQGVTCVSKSMSLFYVLSSGADKIGSVALFYELGKAAREFIYKRPFKVVLSSTQNKIPIPLRELEITAR